MNKNVNFISKNFIGCESNFHDADAVIVGAPYDGTVTFRPGTRFASQAMRTESIGIETYSPYFDKDLQDFKVHDLGDLDLPFGTVDGMFNCVSNTVKYIISENKKPVIIGGEHLISLPVVRELYKKHPDLCIIQFDAHTDLREDYLGEKFSHSTVIRNVWELIGDGKIYQFGIRSGSKEEFSWAYEGHTCLNKFNFEGLEKTIKTIGNRPIYFTLDLDVLDPSVMPGTGTPEAGGVTFLELIDAIKLLYGCNIVGCDIVELSPHYDNTGVSTAVACKLLREILFLLLR